eukprot:221072_1
MEFHEQMDKYKRRKNAFIVTSMYWTETEIVDLLNGKAKQLNDETDRFDALIVAVSCHGMDNNICTSDYKLIDKVYIHRVFSAHYPAIIAIRDIPRIFLFDCCRWFQ